MSVLRAVFVLLALACVSQAAISRGLSFSFDQNVFFLLFKSVGGFKFSLMFSDSLVSRI
jgi:hypothetical protein